MSHFKEVCRYCRGVIRQCKCYAGGDKPVTYKTCPACLDKGFEPEFCNGAANPTPSPDTSDAQALRDLQGFHRSVCVLFNVVGDAPLHRVLKILADFRKRYNEYNEYNAGYSHLMAVCEEALGKDGPFEAADAATRIEQLMQEHKAFAADIVRWEGLYGKLKEDFDKSQERIKHLNDHLDVKDAEIRRLAEDLVKSQEENKALGATNRSWDRDKSKLRTDLDFWRKECDQAREERSKARDDNATLQQHLLDLYKFFSISHVEPFDAGVQQMKEQVRALQEETVALQQICEKLKEDLDLAKPQKDDKAVAVWRDNHTQLATFINQLRNILGEPNCDLIQLRNRVQGEVEVNRTVRGKLQAALGLKDEEVSSHYDLADDVCAQVAAYKDLRRQILSNLDLVVCDNQQDAAVLDLIWRNTKFRREVKRRLGMEVCRDQELLAELDLRLQAPAPAVPKEDTDQLPPFAQAQAQLLDRYYATRPVVPSHIAAEYLSSCLTALIEAMDRRDSTKLREGWKPEGPGWQGALPKPGPLSLDKPDCPISGPRTWRAGNRVAREDIKVGMRFRDEDGCIWEVRETIGADELGCVSLNPNQEGPDYPGRWSRYGLSHRPLAEDFTEGE